MRPAKDLGVPPHRPARVVVPTSQRCIRGRALASRSVLKKAKSLFSSKELKAFLAFLNRSFNKGSIPHSNCKGVKHNQNDRELCYLGVF